MYHQQFQKLQPAWYEWRSLASYLFNMEQFSGQSPVFLRWITDKNDFWIPRKCYCPRRRNPENWTKTTGGWWKSFKYQSIRRRADENQHLEHGSGGFCDRGTSFDTWGRNWEFSVLERHTHINIQRTGVNSRWRRSSATW